MTTLPSTESPLSQVAWAGLARGLGDSWPANVAVASDAAASNAAVFHTGLLAQAEQLARGTQMAQPGTPAALQQVLTRLKLANQPDPQPGYVPQQPLALDAPLFSTLPAPPPQALPLQDDLHSAIRAASQHPALRLDYALDAAMCYAWCLPAQGYGPDTDVSRYNHARATAAVAVCLAQNQLAAAAPAQSFTLIGADLSGIQAFIYTLASAGAAKSLRARSFYLQLLAEVMARYVLRQLGLPITNLLYCGGGGFQILAGAAAQAQTRQIERELQRRLLKAHRAALGITLSAHSFEEKDFSDFGKVRDKLGQTLNRAKRRPFASVSAEDLASQLGQPIDEGGELNFCRVTGEEVPKDTPPDADGFIKSAFVRSLERLGGHLLNSTYMTAKAVDTISPEQVQDWRTALKMFGWSVQLEFDDADTEPAAAVQTLRFRPEPLANGTLSSYYPLARLVPKNKADEIKMFDELATDARSGLKRWAVLRMDVDNLGRMFRDGLGQNASLARTASLSFALRLFFEGWLPELARQSDPDQRLYIQYAGGDDVFVVGAWDAVPELALRIRTALALFAGGNPSVTLSAGIALADIKFPLYQAARLAGEAEHDAKLYAEGSQTKNAVSFLGEVMSWPSFELASREAASLAKWCGPGGLAPRSLLQTLQQIHLQSQAWHKLAAENGRKRTPPVAVAQSKYTRATWLAAYQLSRVIQDLKKRDGTDSIIAQVEGYRDTLIGEHAQSGRIALAARWAQFLIRGETSI